MVDFDFTVWWTRWLAQWLAGPAAQAIIPIKRVHREGKVLA